MQAVFGPGSKGVPFPVLIHSLAGFNESSFSALIQQLGTMFTPERIMAEEPIDCGSGEEGDPHSALAYRIGGLFGILVASLLGFALPNLFTATRFNFSYFLSRTFAAGVVVAVGIVHVFPETVERLENPCLGFSKFPWGPTITLFGVLFTFIFEHTAFMFLARGVEKGNDTETVANTQLDANITPDGMEKGNAVENQETARLLVQNHRVMAYTLEVGIIFHSIFIGLTFGTSRDVSFVQALTVALLFHQGFEGIALGAVVAKARFPFWKVVVFGAAFALTTPLGVVIGIAVSGSFNENNKVFNLFDGIVNSLAAGILIYNGLVDLILPAFNDEEDKPKTRLGTVCGFASLLLGAFAMTIIAKWA